jgi:hypothetical protein
VTATTLAELLQNKTALSRMTHGEIVSALAFLEGAGYDVTKREVYEEQTFKVEDFREDPSETAAIEGDDHA